MAQLIETVLWESTQQPTNGVLPDVKILGQKSKNNRVYTDDALRNSVPLYEGACVYISHAGEKVKHRPATERYGRLKNVRYDDDRKQLRGDLVYLESQAQMTAMLKEDIDRKLNFFGLSHDADGQFHVKNGVKVITQIDRVKSVDVVSDPATATSLKEQADAQVPVTDPGPDPKVEALRGGIMAILDKGGDVATMSASIKEFVDSLGGEGKKEEKKGEAAQEQTDPTIKRLTEQLDALTKQVTAIAKPKKYVTAATGTATTLTEQTDATPVDAPPKDKEALRKWLRK